MAAQDYMTWLITGFSIEVLLASVCLGRFLVEHKKKLTRSTLTVAGVWFVFVLHTLLVGYAIFYSAYRLPLDSVFALAAGVAVSLAGLLLAVGGFIEFRSLSRMSGTRVDKLITTGVYRWSRNPQNVGWGLFLLGLALASRSVEALVLTAVFLGIFRVYVVLEEQHLEWLYGKEWKAYKARTPRFLGLPDRPRLRPAPYTFLSSLNPPTPR